MAARTWRYDAAGRVRSISDTRWGTTAYDYDNLGQLIEAKRGTFAEVFDYDAIGSLQGVLDRLSQRETAIPWGIATGNVLHATKTADYTNDENHRRRTMTDWKTGAVTTYLWDCRDRLREVRLPDGRRVLYTYDAFGRRVRKEIVPKVVVADLAAGRAPAVQVTEFLWDGNALAAELDGEHVARVHVHAPGTFVPLLQAEQGEVFAVVCDHLGMPKELLGQDGRVAWAAAHSAWGQVVEVKGRPAEQGARPVASPFRLLGQYHDEETGLCYTRFRYFEAATGRWLSPDPLGVVGGANLLGFNGNPLNAVDPLGLACDPKDKTRYLLGPNDLDWRGTGKTADDALKEAFRRTGMPIEDFEQTKSAKNLWNKTVPVEWRAPGGAEVNMDFGHPPTIDKLPDGSRVQIQASPGDPHVGWQGSGKGAPVGHILVDNVPAGRSKGK